MTPQPTPAEGHIFLTILLNMKNAPDVDWDLVAQKLGYKNGVVARKRFQQIKIKLSSADTKGGNHLGDTTNEENVAPSALERKVPGGKMPKAKVPQRSQRHFKVAKLALPGSASKRVKAGRTVKM